MFSAFAVIVGIIVFLYFLKIHGDIRYDKGRKDEYQEVVKKIIGEAAYNSFKLDCSPPKQLTWYGKILVKINVVECGRKTYDLDFIEDKKG